MEVMVVVAGLLGWLCPWVWMVVVVMGECGPAVAEVVDRTGGILW
jgi:hypothetical protein